MCQDLNKNAIFKNKKPGGKELFEIESDSDICHNFEKWNI